MRRLTIAALAAATLLLPTQSGTTIPAGQPAPPKPQPAQAEQRPHYRPPDGRTLESARLRAYVPKPCELVDTPARASLGLAAVTGEASSRTEPRADSIQATCMWHAGPAPRLTVAVMVQTTDNEDTITVAAYGFPGQTTTEATIAGVQGVTHRPERPGDTSECGILLYGNNASTLTINLTLSTRADQTCAESTERIAKAAIEKVDR